MRGFFPFTVAGSLRLLPESCVGRTIPAAFLLGLLGFPCTAADEAEKKISGKTLTVTCDKGSVTVEQGEHLLMRYRYEGVPKKPYVAEMTSPGGGNVLLDAPADHPHHHALMFAWTVNGVNFWAEYDDSGLQVHRAWKDLRIDADRGGEKAVLRETISWQTPAGKVLLDEQRKLVVRAADQGEPQTLIWQATFSAGKDATDSLAITGTKYHGLGMRFVKSMDLGGLHFNAAGGQKVAGTDGKTAAWSAYVAEASPGRKVTVAVIGRPSNPRHPPTWFTMGEKPPFAYLSGTFGVDAEALKLDVGKTMSVCFAVVVFDGAADAARIDAVSRTIRWPQQ